MADLLYNRGLQALANAEIDFGAGTNIGVMLVTVSYVPNIDTHFDRADVTNEVTGGNYTIRTALTATVETLDTANDRQVITLPGTTWANATITARGAVYFFDTGVAANDLLIAYNDFGTDISSTAATFTLNSSTITIQNNSAA